MDYLIWWLSQNDCKMIGEPHNKNDVNHEYPHYWAICIIEELPLPDYLKEAYCDRYGRPGRGRLWIPSFLFLESESIEAQVSREIGKLDDSPYCYAVNDIESPLYSKYIEKCGGIVFREEDLFMVEKLPGLITDKYLLVIRKP